MDRALHWSDLGCLGIVDFWDEAPQCLVWRSTGTVLKKHEAYNGKLLKDELN